MCIEKKMERFKSGELRTIFRNIFPHSLHWSDHEWKACLAGGGGNKKRFQYSADSSGTIVYLRALQGHSGCNLIDPSFQDNVIIQSNFFQYIYHVGCAFNLHSIINSGLTPGGQSLSTTDSISILPLVDPMDKNHKDPKCDWLECTASCTIPAQCTEETSRLQNIGSTSILLLRKD